jgi:hypothetical protein
MNIDDRIQREIRRRAFERADFHQHRSASRQYTQHTLEALESVTGLPRLELEAIAAEVSASYEAGSDDFFSIRQQLILAGSAIVPLIALVWFLAKPL